MIFINNSPDVPKKFSSFTKALEDNYENTSSILYWLLGEGIVNFGDSDKLDAKNDFRISYFYNNIANKYLLKFKYVNTEKPLRMTFTESTVSKAYLSMLKGNSFYSQSLIFDDNNLISGGSNSRITLPLRNLISDDVQDYSSEYFSSVYVNGYPQKTSNMTIEPDEKNNKLNIGFSSVYSGGLFPDPVDLYGLFNSSPITGVSAKEWIDYFGKNQTSYVDIYLKFSNSNIYKTPRHLIIRIVDSRTQTVQHFYVPKNLVSDEGIFYTIDPTDEETIIISVNKTSTIYTNYFSPTKYTQNNIKFMFLNALENLSPFSVNFSGLSRKYKLPNRNLVAPDALSELQVLTYDTATNEVSDISLLNTNLLGSLFSLDYTEGTLEILNVLAGQITSTTVVLAYNIKYLPPLQIDYTGDFSSSITIHGTNGSTYIAENVVDAVNSVLNLPKTLYVWAYLKENPKKYFPIVDSSGLLSSVNQYTQLDINFFITETNEYTDILTTTDLTYSNTKPINIGFLNLNTPTPNSTDPVTAFYSFSLNTNLMAPYARYKNLLNDSKVYLLDYKTFKIYDEPDKPVVTPVRTIGTGTSAKRVARKYYRVGYVPANTEIIEFYGYLGRNRTVYNDTGDVLVFNDFYNNIQYFYNAKLKILDASILYQLEKRLATNPSSTEDYTGISIDVFNLVDPDTSSLNISKEYTQLVSNDTSESTIFAPRYIEQNFLDLISNKVLVLEVDVPVADPGINSLVFNLDFDFYLKFIPRVVNYVNTL